MKKINNLINEYGGITVLLLLIIIFLRTCGMNTKAKNLDKKIDAYYVKMDSTIKSLESKVILLNKKEIIERKIEGLKNEKRMIQATDRRIIDYQRENEIDNEIKIYEKELNTYGN